MRGYRDGSISMSEVITKHLCNYRNTFIISFIASY